MQNRSDAPLKEGPKPKRPPRWRDLSDEEQWERIYADRERKKAASPKNVAQATALALPAYCMHMAIDDCHKTFQATIRHDVHTAIVTTMAKVSALLPNEAKRERMLNRMHCHYLDVKSAGFFLNNREFLYVNAAALVRIVDDWRYPPDAPVVGAALLLKDDAEDDEAGEWGLDKGHALRMVGKVYDTLLKTGLYAYPDGKVV